MRIYTALAMEHINLNQQVKLVRDKSQDAHHIQDSWHTDGNVITLHQDISVIRAYAAENGLARAETSAEPLQWVSIVADDSFEIEEIEPQ